MNTKQKIRVQLFGDFSLKRGNVILNRTELHSNKVMKLLAYLILYRNRKLTRQELMDIFWEDESKNPAGALKNLMYRLRVALKVLGEEEFISTYSGGYQWNPEIEVETDYECFEELGHEIYKETDLNRKKELCIWALEHYSVDISEKLENESWIIPKIVWFRSKYIDVVKELCEIYNAEAEWVLLENLCEKALEVDVMDEDVHCWQIRSLYHQKKYDMAMQHYEKVSKMLYDQFGIRETEKLHSVFVDMMAEGQDQDVGSIRKLISEVREQETPRGVFFCDYQVFRQIYRVEARRMKRMCTSEYILLLTVRRKKRLNVKADDAGLAKGMAILEELLRSSLRIGDVVARYSLSQYVVMLPLCSFETGTIVAGRLNGLFNQAIGKLQLELHYELEEITCA